jgi:hypothetical protein
MDIATFTSAYSSLKIAKDIFQGFSDLKMESDSIGKINEAVKKVGEAQHALFQLRDDLFRLQEENNSLKITIRDSTLWEDKIAEYDLVKTVGEAIVYKYKNEPEHYICPSCTSKKSIQILQDNKSPSGSFSCNGCSSHYTINEEVEFKPIQHGSYWP